MKKGRRGLHREVCTFGKGEENKWGTRKKEEKRRMREKDGRLTLSMRSRHSALSTHSMSAQSIPSLLAELKHYCTVYTFSTIINHLVLAQ